jgi:hypothetical protein
MLYWETADQDPSLDDSMHEWAAIWKRLPRRRPGSGGRSARRPGAGCRRRP